MGFSLDVSVPVLTVFLQGLVSFFSPCVLPLIPLYIGYLSGGTQTVGEDGKITYKRSKVMVNTLFFVLGISFTFFLLGIGVSALGTFFNSRQLLFARIGGILVLIFGIYQLGIVGKPDVLQKEHRLPFRLNTLAMSPLMALLMGFTFSFAWTPCVGPALTSVLIMTASAGTKAMGFVLIGVYTLGFVLPFLAVGLFTTTLLDLFKRHRKVVQYTVKVGGVLMILMGVMMITGKMNAVTGYLSNVTSQQIQGDKKEQASVEDQASTDDLQAEDAQPEDIQAEDVQDKEQTPDQKENSQAKPEESAVQEVQGPEEEQPKEQAASNDTAQEEPSGGEEEQPQEKPLPDIVDFTLQDQYGNTHTLSDYKGKTVFLNFWGTWCPPCRAEMPDIQKIYEEYGQEDLVVLGVAGPNYGREGSQEDIEAFLEENGYTYPVVFDTTGELFTQYGIYSFPSTFMITTEGKVYGYVTGQLNEDTMKSIITQTMEGRQK